MKYLDRQTYIVLDPEGSAWHVWHETPGEYVHTIYLSAIFPTPEPDLLLTEGEFLDMGFYQGE